MLARSTLIALFCTFLQKAELSPVNNPVFYDPELALDYFLDYVKTYDKVYERGEAAQRYQNFVDNLVLINERNKKQQGGHAINIFADTSEAELTRTKLGYLRLNHTDYRPVTLSGVDFKPPLSIDWREKNVVTDVKHQGECQSCWAFSAVATIESQYAIKYGKLRSFSEQQLVDCDPINEGCRWGSTNRAFEYLEQAGGLELESDYKYLDAQGQCQFQHDKAVARVTRPQVSMMTEEQMAAKVASYGPISVVICVHPSLYSYAPGSIWEPRHCPTTYEDCVDEHENRKGHVVTIVGYGVDRKPYWIIKNSWGKNWGDNGYFKMRRGRGLCMITSEVSTVSVV